MLVTSTNQFTYTLEGWKAELT